MPKTAREITATYSGSPPLIVQLPSAFEMTDDQFIEFAQMNRDLRIERTARGDLIIMPPAGGETGNRNAELTMQLRAWAKKDGRGTTFDSSTGFVLPNGAIRSPDGCWVRNSSLAALTLEQRKKFLPLCPEFLVELRSPSDSTNDLQDKMREYIDNGAQLGWLIDADQKRVYVYRPNMPVEELDQPEFLTGESLLSGFMLDLREIW